MRKLVGIDGMSCGHCAMKVKSAIEAGYRVLSIIP